ncbi:GMC oxidoreductase family protein [Abortiporus biennis]
MRSLTTSLLTALSLSSLALSHSVDVPDIHKRNIVYDGQIEDTYDFVIVGGGTAGLVLAARLSEDSNHTVLVLEAGDTGDAVKSSIDNPANAYYQSLLGSSYDWHYTTVPQTHAANRAIAWARGKVLGGSSAVNGMYAVRPSQIEVDAWAGMIENGTAWNWENQFAAMKKSETFTPPSADIQAAANIEYNTASHGTSGPVHVSYPGYMVPVVGNWSGTLAAVGVPPSVDANAGENWGQYIAASTINPTNWTRSYSRSAYIDPLPNRSNLAILANATVTRLIFDNSTSNANGVVATAVEYAANVNAAKQTVKVRKEVILAGGAIGSPQVLQLSGVGPVDVLNGAGVPVVVELPGVGQHLQDHISTQVVYTTNVDTAGSLHAANADIPNFLSFINSATTYVNASTLLASSATSLDAFKTLVTSNLNTANVPSQYSEVAEGYKAIYSLTQDWLSGPVGQVEILLSLTGSASGAQTIAVQAALQHPFSQGRLYINSSNAFDYPVIDPNYLSNPADGILLREGLKLARKIATTAPLSSAMLTEVVPGSTVATDADWDNWLATTIGTEFHPSCSCAMLPKAQGGVVDANLKVYGTSNVRVADAAVYPIQFSAHLMAPVYGLAEQAASIIRAQYNVVASSSSSSSSGAPSPTTSATNTTGGNTSASMKLASSSWAIALVSVAFYAVFGL